MPEKSFAFGSVVLAIVWGIFFYPPPPDKRSQQDNPAAASRVAIKPGVALPLGQTILR